MVSATQEDTIMQISSTLNSRLQSTNLRHLDRPQTRKTETTQAQPSDSFTFGSVKDRVVPIAIAGAIGLVGAAAGAYAGSAEGVLAGIAGAGAGLSGGLALSYFTPSQKAGLPAMAGAVAGAIIGGSMSNNPATFVLGLAGAAAPFAGMVALGHMIST
jgi:hypothetical protein